MEAYKGLKDVYYFPDTALVTELMTSIHQGIRLESAVTPSGPCHEHLRILSFRRER